MSSSGIYFYITVRIIVQFLYQDGHVRYKPTFSVFVRHVTVLVQKLNNNSHNKCKSKSPKETRFQKSGVAVSFCLSMVFHGMSFSFAVYGLGLLVKVWFVFISLFVPGHLRWLPSTILVVPPYLFHSLSLKRFNLYISFSQSATWWVIFFTILFNFSGDHSFSVTRLYSF